MILGTKYRTVGCLNTYPERTFSVRSWSGVGMHWRAATRQRCETPSTAFFLAQDSIMVGRDIHVQRAGGIRGLHGAQHRSTRDSAPPLVPHQVQRRISREAQGIDTLPALAVSTTAIVRAVASSTSSTEGGWRMALFYGGCFRNCNKFHHWRQGHGSLPGWVLEAL